MIGPLRSSKGLIAVSDPGRAGFLARAFHSAGLIPVLAFGQPEILSCLELDPIALLVIDPKLLTDPPPVFLRAVRARSEAALLILSSEPVAPGAWLGGEEVSPAATPEEVALRGKALVELRGSGGAVLRWGRLQLDLARREASWRGAALQLTRLQFRILRVLVEARGAVVATESLSRELWGSSIPADHERLFAHIRRIRKKIEENPSRPVFLLTVRGEGYRLREPDEPLL